MPSRTVLIPNTDWCVLLLLENLETLLTPVLRFGFVF